MKIALIFRGPLIKLIENMTNLLNHVGLIISKLSIMRSIDMPQRRGSARVLVAGRASFGKRFLLISNSFWPHIYKPALISNLTGDGLDIKLADGHIPTHTHTPNFVLF